MNNKDYSQGQKLSIQETTDKLPYQLQILEALLQETSDEIQKRALIEEYLSVRPLLTKSLAGKHLEIDKSLISFGSNNQSGDVSIRDIAGGNIYTTTINHSITQSGFANIIIALLSAVISGVIVIVVALNLPLVLPENIKSSSTLISILVVLLAFFGIIRSIAFKPEMYHSTRDNRDFNKEELFIAGFKRTIIRRDREIHYYEISILGKRVFSFDIRDDKGVYSILGIPIWFITSQGVSIGLITTMSICIGALGGGIITQLPNQALVTDNPVTLPNPVPIITATPKEVEATYTPFVTQLNKEVASSKRGFSVILSRVETMANGNSRWHFEFLNTSESRYCVLLNKEQTYIVDNNSAEKYSILESSTGDEAIWIETRTKQEIWLDFATPNAESSQVSVVLTNNYPPGWLGCNPTFETFPVEVR